jgi:hypothetical protein
VVATAEATHNSDLDAAISHMELEFIQCRDFGHSWRPYSARWLPSDNCYESQLRCARCKAIRTRWLSRTGSQVGGGYDYADGYLVKGIGRLTGTDRDKIRLASVLVLLWATAEVASLHGGDHVLREGVADLLRGTRKLLNASWGPRLDMGTVDRQIVEIAEGIGYNLEIEEFE